MDALNEVFYYMILVISFSFTMYNPDEDARWSVGEFFNILIGAMMSTNAIVMIYGKVRLIYRLSDKSCRLRKHRKEMKRKLKLWKEK